MFDRIFRSVLGLQFLPATARKWIFGTGTRLYESFNCMALLLVGCIILLDSGAMFAMPPYRGFYSAFGVWTDEIMGGAMLLAGVFALAGLMRNAPSTRMLGGYAMVLSSCLWGLIAAGFAASFPPLNTAMGIYSVMAIFGLLTGEHVIYELKRR